MKESNSIKKAEAVCITADGQSHDEAWLKDRLNGMTAEIYQSIYGFSADDLSEIEYIKEENLGEVLLGIGFTGASKLHQIEKRLSTKLGELFKPGGKLPEINRELEKLEQLQEKIAVYDHEESDYLDKKQEMHDLENRIDLLQKKQKDIQEKHLHLEKLQHALPALKDYQIARKQLQKMAGAPSFPQEGVKRLTALKDRLLPIQSELSVLEKNRKADLHEIRTLKEKIKDFPQKQVEGLQHDYIQFQQRQIEITQCKQLIQADTIGLKTTLADLDIGLSIEDATKMHLPFHIEKTWEQLKK
ncbi:AAA family ATPase [Virgibacillus halophilus]|uniref:AAA family ATPase n=1 Tax=Tigheibacillus halophilus TaxID=361280 RepID=A0ABU5C9J1_9BACI|nr:AAA family ATPase [Virgibacillus halophilus]